MDKHIVVSGKAPRPIGPYSQAVEAGDFIFMSGQVGIDPATGKLVEGGVQAQADQVLKNMTGVLSAMGLDLTAVVKTVVFITDMAHFGPINEIYGGYFSQDPPARSCVAVRELPAGALVEIEAVAIKNR